jgi:hypothetical protein
MTSGECKVEMKVTKGSKSIARGVRVNGCELPGVADVIVTYTPRDVRRVTIELLPTDVIEVDEADW